MKYSLKLTVIAAIVSLALFQSCKRKAANNNLQRFTSSTTKIAVDESFQPIFEEELYIFKALYNNVNPTIVYAPENNAVNLLLDDSVRVAVLSRELNTEELKALNTKNLKPIVNRFAIDAIALIVNKVSNDTTITISEIKKMLNGDTKQDKNIVFDNPNSGLVRYLKNFSGSRDFKQKNIYALKSNKDVIKYVSTHPDAIGITDFSWLNDPDKDYADAVDNVKIVGVMDDVTKNASKEYFTPSQNTLALKQYPLTRDLYILNCTGSLGLGMEFAAFMASDRGQRIILKSGLLPNDIPGREINMQNKISTSFNQ
ncbi:MAG: hypothetical protein JWP45_3494 [Mucilaginibacter sp.]|nr:hypothetical protein [Mucilaginibacter sp.]